MTNRKRRAISVLMSAILALGLVITPMGCQTQDPAELKLTTSQAVAAVSEYGEYGSGNNGDCFTQHGYWYCVGQCAACNTGAAAAIAALATAAVTAPGAFVALLAEGGWAAVGTLTVEEVAKALGVTAAALIAIPGFWAWFNTCRMCYGGLDPI